MRKELCTEICKGKIKKIKLRGTDFPRVLIVEYEVNGIQYEISENQVMKPYKKIKLGFIPIGYKTKSLIEINTGIQTIVGNEVKVKYNPENPKEAYLPDNDAKVTWD